MSNKIVIIPCSGIGKPYGTIGRDATYIVCDEKLRENTETDCLGLLVIEDEEIVEKVRSCKVVSVDGCFNECARKSVERVGAEVTEAIHVWKFHQENKDLKPRAVTFLDEDGRELSKRLAEHIIERIEEISGGGE